VNKLENKEFLRKCKASRTFAEKLFSLKNYTFDNYQQKILTICGFNFVLNIDYKKRLAKVQNRYEKVINKLKKKNSKIRVLFLVSENSKWKAQSLYDLMAASNDFEPIIALTALKAVHIGLDTTRNNIEDDFKFFKDKGMNVVKAYKNHKYLKLNVFKPDIVFYQQPWDLDKTQAPEVVSEFALTYYIPYYVSVYDIQSIDYEQNLHKYVYKYYCLNKWWEEQFKQKSTLTNVVGLGHTMLDLFQDPQNYKHDKQYVIYAPHYSVNHELNENAVNYGTFLQNGELILNYAKNHPEINWVFKPHPQLKYTLLKIGKSIDEVERYYNEWGEIGQCCYDSTYIDLFLDSKLLITDCSSFLTEYFCTSNPIVHLISPTCKPTPSKFAEKIFGSFYKVRTNEELLKCLDDLLVKNNDYNKDVRLKVLEETGLLKNNAAKNILQDIKQTIGRDLS
jgi:CDP-glycerol glycerophosphotransferase (TagB/SpsB family)